MRASAAALLRLVGVVAGAAWRALTRGTPRPRPVVPDGPALVWACDWCGREEPANVDPEERHHLGDSEPCVACDGGTARVVPAAGDRWQDVPCTRCGARVGAHVVPFRPDGRACGDLLCPAPGDPAA